MASPHHQLPDEPPPELLLLLLHPLPPLEDEFVLFLMLCRMTWLHEVVDDAGGSLHAALSSCQVVDGSTLPRTCSVKVPWSCSMLATSAVAAAAALSSSPTIVASVANDDADIRPRPPPICRWTSSSYVRILSFKKICCCACRCRLRTSSCIQKYSIAHMSWWRLLHALHAFLLLLLLSYLALLRS